MNILSFRCGKLAAAGAKNNHSGPANASLCALHLLKQAPNWRSHGRKFLKSSTSRDSAIASLCADAGKRPCQLAERSSVDSEEKSCASASICVIDTPRAGVNFDRSASQRPLWISAGKAHHQTARRESERPGQGLENTENHATVSGRSAPLAWTPRGLRRAGDWPLRPPKPETKSCRIVQAGAPGWLRG